MTLNFQTGRFGRLPAFKLWDTLLFSRPLMPSRIQLKVCNFPACLTRHTFLCCSFTLRLCPRHDQPIESIFFASRQLSLSLLRIISVTPILDVQFAFHLLKEGLLIQKLNETKIFLRIFGHQIG